VVDAVIPAFKPALPPVVWVVSVPVVVGVVVEGFEAHHQMPAITRRTTIMPIIHPQVLSFI
jgi:hypothetical protein